jgi:ATP-dependent DNA helicase Rep
MTPERLEEERRLMYVGITRARTTLMVSHLRRSKKGRETVAGVPSRFIAEMKLDEGVVKEDARERLKRVRAELAAKSDAAAAAQAVASAERRAAPKPAETRTAGGGGTPLTGAPFSG